MNTDNVKWILHNSVNDGNRINRIPQATDEELFYCLSQEKRVAGISTLLSELKKRGLVFKGRKLPTDIEVLFNTGDELVSYTYIYETETIDEEEPSIRSCDYSHDFSKEELLDPKKRLDLLNDVKMYVGEHDTPLEGIQDLLGNDKDKPVIFYKKSLEDAYEHLIKYELDYLVYILPEDYYTSEAV